MSSSKKQKATAEEVEQEASRYILYQLGDQLWAGEPIYDESHEQWTAPIRAKSLGAEVSVGEITLGAQGNILHAPSRRDVLRAVTQVANHRPRNSKSTRAMAQRLRQIFIPQPALALVSVIALVALGLLFIQFRNNQALQAQLQQDKLMVAKTQDVARLQDTAGQVTLQLSLPGNLSLPPESAQRVEELLMTGMASQPESVQSAMAQLRRHDGERRGEGEKDAPVLLSPVATAVKSTHPAFFWKHTAGARSYKLAISQQNKTVWKDDAGRQTEFSLPADAPGLKPGEIYSWQIEATVDGELRLSRKGRFRVLEEAALAEVERIERQLAGQSTLVLAAVYEAHGLYDDAQKQFERLQQQNPDSPLVKKMSEALQQQRGWK